MRIPFPFPFPALVTALALSAAGTAAAGSAIQNGAFAVSNQGVRAMGMGGAMTGLADDSSANFWNPAGLCTVGKGEFALGHASLYGVPGLTSQFVSYGVGELATRGWGVAYTRVQAKIGTDEPGRPQNLWGEQSMQIGVSQPVLDLPSMKVLGGVSARYNSTSSDLSGEARSQGYSFDAGVLVIASKQFLIGARVRDIGSTTRWQTGLIEPIPYNWAVGASYRATRQLVVAAESESLQDSAPKGVRLGGEYALQDEAKGPLYKQLTNVALRAGGVVGLAGGGAQIAAGTSLKFATAGAGFAIDYAFLFDSTGLGNTHRVGLTVRR